MLQHYQKENKFPYQKRRKERDSTPEARARKKELRSTDKSKAKDAERYQKNKEGVIFRASYTPIIEFNKYFRHWGGLTIGYAF